MNSFFFLTFSLLIVVQIQTGVMENQTTPISATQSSTTPTPTMSVHSPTQHTHPVGAMTSIKITKSTMRSGAPALGYMAGGNFFLFLANTLIHFLYLS